MSDDYSVFFESEMSGEGTGVLILFWLIYGIFMLALSVVPYVLQSLGFYSIAKRRGIKHPWLSWIPVGSAWILGCISDQFQYVVKGKVKNKRKALLVLNIILWTVGVVVYAALFTLFFGMIFAIVGSGMNPSISESQMELMMEQMIMENIDRLLVMVAGYWVVACLSIAVMIIQYICLYDLYSSCEPKNNVLYLVLGIFVSICQPIFIFICRNKDGGMPPRKQEQPAYIPQEPQEPWENRPEP